ncbi:hypothetical protein ACSBR1_005215 [Camellia fascicularis]
MDDMPSLFQAFERSHYNLSMPSYMGFETNKKAQVLWDCAIFAIFGRFVCRKCIYEKVSDEEVDSCPVCNIDLGCVPVEKLRVLLAELDQSLLACFLQKPSLPLCFFFFFFFFMLSLSLDQPHVKFSQTIQTHLQISAQNPPYCSNQQIRNSHYVPIKPKSSFSDFFTILLNPSSW